MKPAILALLLLLLINPSYATPYASWNLDELGTTSYTYIISDSVGNNSGTAYMSPSTGNTLGIKIK